MPQDVANKLRWLLQEIEDAMANGEFSSCDEDRVVTTIDELRDYIG